VAAARRKTVALAGVFGEADDDGDGCGCRLGRKRRRITSGGDHCDLSANQFGRQRWQAVYLIIGPAVRDRHVLAQASRFLSDQRSFHHEGQTPLDDLVRTYVGPRGASPTSLRDALGADAAEMAQRRAYSRTARSSPASAMVGQQTALHRNCDRGRFGATIALHPAIS
jgi:hypothetical protein